MLINLRKSAGSWIVKSFLLLLVASFAVWGVGDILRSGGDTAVIVVGDREVSTAEFSRAYQQQFRQLSNQLGGTLTPDQAREFGLVGATLQQLIASALLDETAGRLGIVVPDSVIAAQIRANPTFHNTSGEFDRLIYGQALRAAGMSPEYFEAQSRVESARRQLLASVSDGAVAPRPLAEAVYRYREERRAAELLVVPATAIQDVGTPDEAALAAFHRDNIVRFTAPEYRTVSFVTLLPEDLISEVAVSEEELREAFDDRAGEFFTPERRTVEQMLFADSIAAGKAHSLVSEGMDFAAAAREAGSLNPDDLLLGQLTEADLPDEARAMVFALPADGVSGPVETGFGWHVFRVTAIEPGQDPGFNEVRDELEAEIALVKAQDVLFEISNALEDELAGGARLADAAARVDLRPRHIEAVDNTGRDPAGELVSELPNDPEFLDAVFGAEEGVETPLTETGNGLSFIVLVERVTPPIERPLTTVRDEVTEAWRVERRKELTAVAAEEIAARARGGAMLAGLASEHGHTFTAAVEFGRQGSRDDPSLSRELAAALFAGAPGEVVTAPRADGNGYVVARLSEVLGTDVGANSQRLAELQRMLRQGIAADLLHQYRTHLGEDLGVEVNEELLVGLF